VSGNVGEVGTVVLSMTSETGDVAVVAFVSGDDAAVAGELEAVVVLPPELHADNASPIATTMARLRRRPRVLDVMFIAP
jgi:hypothetical protein